ncbi:MAG: hypothetical protein L6R00_20030 [Phycisphaerae bacterium]|nr:hypothetical protein [Phycisphaerae bacterium]
MRFEQGCEQSGRNTVAANIGDGDQPPTAIGLKDVQIIPADGLRRRILKRDSRIGYHDVGGREQSFLNLTRALQFLNSVAFVSIEALDHFIETRSEESRFRWAGWLRAGAELPSLNGTHAINEYSNWAANPAPNAGRRKETNGGAEHR